MKKKLSKEIEIAKNPAVMHGTKLRTLSWFNTLIPRYATVKKWGRGARYKSDEKVQLDMAHKSWMMKLGRILGYRDIPAPNQMTGFLADGLFKESNRDTVVEAVNEMVQEYQSHQMSGEEKEAFRQLLQYLAVVSRVLSSDNVIKVFEFADYCKRAYTFILTAFPWALLSESIHRYQYYKVFSIKRCLKRLFRIFKKKSSTHQFNLDSIEY